MPHHRTARDVLLADIGRGLYLSVLDRLPDAAGHTSWTGLLLTGLPRSVPAHLIFRSVEGNGQRVDTMYARLLNRAVDAAGRIYWSQMLVTHDDLELAGLLVGSPEYLTLAQGRFQSASVTTTPGTTVLVPPEVVALSLDGHGIGGIVVIAAGRPVPAVGTRLLVSVPGPDGFAAGTASEVVTYEDGSKAVAFTGADLTDVLSKAAVRSTVELPRTSVTVSAGGQTEPDCFIGTPEMGHRTTADVGFDGRLNFDRAADTHDVRAVVSVASNITAVMSTAGRTDDCTWRAEAWSANWDLAVSAGPIHIPMVVDIDGTFEVTGRLSAAFRTSTTATVACQVGFTAVDGAETASSLGCGAVRVRSGAAPGGAGEAADRTTVEVYARLGTPMSGVLSAMALEPAIITTGVLTADPWWSTDVTVDSQGWGQVRLTPWGSAVSWPSTRVALHHVADAGATPLPPADRPPVVATTWLARGAVGEPYTMQLGASGGEPGYTWAVRDLPAGLAVSGDRISGTPTTATTIAVAMTVTDAAGGSDTRGASLVIGPAGTSTALDRITDGDGSSLLPDLSADGRYVVFGSSATNIDPVDSMFSGVNVFTFDRATGVVIRITDANQFATGGPSTEPWSISADGRYVAFESASAALVPGDFNGVTDIFVWDRVTDRTVRITDGNGHSRAPKISADGGDVAFESQASDLASADENQIIDVFLWSRSTGQVARLSGSGGGDTVGLSADAGSATFNVGSEAYLLDISTGVRTRIAASTRYAADLSADGGVVAFDAGSSAKVWDRATGVTRTVTATTESRPSISADGMRVAYESWSEVGGQFRTTIAVWESELGTSERVAETRVFTSMPTISGDGSTVAFWSSDTELVPPDGNAGNDVFVRHR